jgi:hypothetical protein
VARPEPSRETRLARADPQHSLMSTGKKADIPIVSSVTSVLSDGPVLPMSPVPPKSRAVLRFIDPGNDAVCERCGEQVKFVARSKGRQVIANVYVDGRWDRVEHYHDACYEEAAEPYGAAQS